ncbi:MAG: hypothetical protein WKG07_09345 [Hymenobacter sp.]
MLFPKLIAGPIVRFHEIAGQLTDRRAFDTADEKLAGLFRFSVGWPRRYSSPTRWASRPTACLRLDPGQLSAASAWLGALAYTFQIYFDFSGYSDMAIGLGRPDGLSVSRKLQLALRGPLHHRVLAALAHHAGPLDARLPLRAAGRQPCATQPVVFEPVHRVRAVGPVAWGGLDVCGLGSLPRRVAGGRAPAAAAGVPAPGGS